MTKDEKKKEVEKYLNEYKITCDKIIDQGGDANMHPIELIYGVASTGLMAATLQAQGFTEDQINTKFEELTEKAKELKEQLVGEEDSILTSLDNKVTIKKETLH